MNRHFIFAGIFMLLGLCAAAQPADSTAVDSLRRIGDVDTGPVTMRRAADGDNMVLEVAGFGITIGPSTIQGASNRDTKSRPRVCGLFFDGIEMGFNFLTGPDYAGYPAGTGDFLDVRGGNSFHFGVTPGQTGEIRIFDRPALHGRQLPAVRQLDYAGTCGRPDCARSAGREGRQVEIPHHVAGHSAAILVRSGPAPADCRRGVLRFCARVQCDL